MDQLGNNLSTEGEKERANASQATTRQTTINWSRPTTREELDTMKDILRTDGIGAVDDFCQYTIEEMIVDALGNEEGSRYIRLAEEGRNFYEKYTPRETTAILDKAHHTTTTQTLKLHYAQTIPGPEEAAIYQRYCVYAASL